MRALLKENLEEEPLAYPEEAWEHRVGMAYLVGMSFLVEAGAFRGREGMGESYQAPWDTYLGASPAEIEALACPVAKILDLVEAETLSFQRSHDSTAKTKQ